MKYFDVDELCDSDVAHDENIDNVPNEEQRANIIFLIDTVLDPLREAWGGPISVSSGFRCEELNVAVGGSRTSAHKQGLAADLFIYGGTSADNEKLGKLAASMCKFDQVIFESVRKRNGLMCRWVHIGIRQNGENNRGEVLVKYIGDEHYYNAKGLL